MYLCSPYGADSAADGAAGRFERTVPAAGAAALQANVRIPAGAFFAVCGSNRMQKTSRAEADKPPKAGGARKRSASQAPPEGNAGRERRPGITGGSADPNAGRKCRTETRRRAARQKRRQKRTSPQRQTERGNVPRAKHRRRECRAEIRAATQTGNNGRKYPAGTTKTKKTFFNELL